MYKYALVLSILRGTTPKPTKLVFFKNYAQENLWRRPSKILIYWEEASSSLSVCYVFGNMAYMVFGVDLVKEKRKMMRKEKASILSKKDYGTFLVFIFAGGFVG